MNKLNQKTNYIDITNMWLQNAIYYSEGKLIYRNFFVDKKNKKYFVDGKKVLFNLSQEEIDIAKVIKKHLKGNIYLNPKVNDPKHIESSDYLYRNEYWDLKSLGKNATSKKRAVDNAVKNAKNQTDNIIIHINGTKISQDIIIQQVKKLYSTAGREWINKIIVIKNYKIIKIYSRKK